VDYILPVSGLADEEESLDPAVNRSGANKM